MTTTKRCHTCGEAKPLDDFYAHPNGADGHMSSCKPCQRAYMAAWRKANREKARGQLYRWRGRHPERVKAIDARWRRRQGMEPRTEIQSRQAERRARALEMRLGGATWEAIGAELGVTKQAAQSAVRTELRLRGMRLVPAFRLVPISPVTRAAATPPARDDDGEEMAAWAQ